MTARMRHHHEHGRTGRKLFISIILNGAITVVELVGGILSNSLALVSDALHNFSDVFALLMSYLGEKVKERPSTYRMTYGYRRTETLIALINGSSLVGIAIYIFVEAYDRFQHPQPVSWRYVLAVGGCALGGNLLSVWILHSEKDRNLNVRSAFLHLLYDAVSSVGVMIAAVVIWLTSWYPVDLIISLMIGALIIGGSWDLLKGIYMVLMEAAPRDMATPEIMDFMRTFKGVLDVHHVHLWSVSSNLLAVSAHIVLDEAYLAELDHILDTLTQALKEQYQLDHVTLQPELRRCADPAPHHEFQD
jgi:cobalt-zinc-cadmium efflux system protein